MALDQSALTELLDALKAGGDLDFMRRAMEVVLQLLIELEVHVLRDPTRGGLASALG